MSSTEAAALNVSPRYLLFSTLKYSELTAAMSSQMPVTFELGKLETKNFADGEHYSRIVTSAKHRDVVLVGGTVSDEDTLELYDLASGLVDAGAHRLLLVIPYFGYSTMERAVKTGEIVKAKTRARLLSSIPLPGSGASVVLLDLHVDSIAYYFEGNVRPWHLSGRPLILQAIREGLQVEGEEFVMASTDAGRAKIVESFANDLRVPASFVFKRRTDSGATAVTAVSAQVAGKHVIIYDDSEFYKGCTSLNAHKLKICALPPSPPTPLLRHTVIRTGGSLVGAAQAYRDAGANKISVISTHGVFAGDSVAKLESCGLISRVVVTDSHPAATLAAKSSPGFVKVVSIAGLLSDYLKGL